ncbi:MAG TPA: cellulose synthase family protein [Thermodesulfobacteriota bacterium]|nr:cellulose synthase family protein [Thermodesulfobacteriota bacterium]
METLVPIAKALITAIYLSAFVFLCIFGLYRYYLVYVFNKYKKRIPQPKGRLEELPMVTIQLPVYNEMYVIRRLISYVCDIDYPKELLEIQVLDDSIDETSEIAEDCVNTYRAQGFQMHYIHRERRTGFKAGALEEGLKSAKGELIAIFDADFMPSKDFLLKTVHFFSDPNIGMVQVRWGHINRRYSTLTKAQSILLDGHFVIEQAARFYSGKFFNFNGTAGVLRKKCIESAGGWQHDTLTEDMDLSYRAQLKGWKFIYLKDMTVDAELPVDMNAFKSQQYRWAKGAIQTAKKLLLKILSTKELPLGIKIEAAFHLLGNLCYVFLMILLILMLPIAYLWGSIGWENAVLMNLAAISAGTVSVVRFYIVTIKEIHRKRWTKYLKYIPLAIALGTGLAIANSKAVLEAVFGRRSEFRRTPKFAVTSRRDKWRKAKYVARREVTTFLELGIGLFFVSQTLYAFFKGYIEWIPFLVVIQLGFLYTSILSISHSLGRQSVEMPPTISRAAKEKSL